MMQQDEQGWSFTDEHVCAGCVDDALEPAIRRAADDDEACDFCGRTPAAPLDVLLEAFVSGLRNEYGTADDEAVYWDGGKAVTRGGGPREGWLGHPRPSSRLHRSAPSSTSLIYRRRPE